MPELLNSAWFVVAVPVATSFLCFVSAIGIVAAILLNRGAKVNLSWGLIAFGLLGLCVAQADGVLANIGFSNLGGWRELVRLCGAILIFSGVVYGRDILRRLVK